MNRIRNAIGSCNIARIFILITMLIISSQGKAWIAYGFKSGISRFDAMRYLSENESLIVTDGARQTYAGPEDNKTKYNLTYCSTPQKLYLMHYDLEDSLQAFIKTKEKYESRYGDPTPLNDQADNWEADNWEHVDVSFIWDLNEFETIVLTHNKNGTQAEFQDLSVCN